MTLVKRGALSGLQIYLSVPWAKKPVTFRNPPPWTLKVENLSGPQLLAAYSLARAAYDYAYGETGKMKYKGVMMPIGAVKVAMSVSKGAGIHGGRTPEKRRELRHTAAAATLTYLESLIKAKGLALPSVTKPTI